MTRMVKRFTDVVNIQPQSLSTGFVEGSGSLVNRLRQFGKTTDALVEAVETQRGQEEAQQAISEGQFESKEAGAVERFLTGGVATKQYNKAVQTAYLAGLSNDAREQISLIEAQNPDNIIQFNEKAGGYIKGVLDEVDPAVRDQVAQYLDTQLTNSRIRVHGNAIKRNKDAAFAESSAAIEGFSNEAYSLARQGDNIGAAEQMAQAFSTIDSLLESGDISKDKAVSLKRDIERESSEQVKRKEYDDIIESEGFSAAFEQLKKDSKKVPKGWTPDEWDSFTASAQSDIRQAAILEGQIQSEKSSEDALSVSELKIKGSTGFDSKGNAIPPGDIIKEADRMFADGSINGATRASVISSVINRQKKDVSNIASIEKVANKLAGAAEIPLERSEVDYAWDNYYSKVTENMTDQQNSAFVAQFVNSTKIIPSSVTAQVENNLNSGNVDLIVQSADLMARLDQVRGLPEDNFSANDRAFAESVTELSLNMDTELAVKLAKENTNPNDSARIEARKGIIKEEEFSDDYRDDVEDGFESFFGFTRVDDISGDRLAKEYGSIFEQHFISGMSEKKAKAKALEIVKRNWRESDVTGVTRVMKYAPEDYYDVAGNTEYIGDQLFKEVRDTTFGLGEFSKENIILMSDDRTSREASAGQPSYLVYVNTDEGLIPVLAEGAPARFVPDVQAEVKRQQKLNREKLEKGRSDDLDLDELLLKGGF